MTSDKNPKDDPALHAENDDAPFKRTSEAAAAARQAGKEPASKPGEDVHANDKAMGQTDEVSAASNLTRAHSSTPVRARRDSEGNPELDKGPGKDPSHDA